MDYTERSFEESESFWLQIWPNKMIFGQKIPHK